MDTTHSKPRVTFEFEVEKVIGVSNDGRYQVKWAPAWVSKFHLVGCEHLIQEFLQQQYQQQSEQSEQPKQQQVQQQMEQQQQQEQLQQRKQQHQAEENIKAVPEDKFEQPDLSYRNSVDGDLARVRELSCEEDNNQHGLSGHIDEDQSYKERDCLSTELEDSIPKPIDSDCGAIEIKIEENESHFQLTYQQNDKNHLIPTLSAAVAFSPTDQSSVSLESTPASASEAEQLFDENHSPDTVPFTKNLGICHNNVQTSSEVELLDLSDTTTAPTPEENQRPNLHNDESEGSPASLVVQPRARKKGFPCPYCEKEFTRNAKLSRHILIHTGEQPFSCEICGKSFRQKENVKQHMRIHTGEKPFLCNICGKSYKCNYNLQTHMNTHTGDKPFACTSCGKAFNDSSHCRRHTKRCSSVT